jgi:hypothetical protein
MNKTFNFELIERIFRNPFVQIGLAFLAGLTVYEAGKAVGEFIYYLKYN